MLDSGDHCSGSRRLFLRKACNRMPPILPAPRMATRRLGRPRRGDWEFVGVMAHSIRLPESARRAEGEIRRRSGCCVRWVTTVQEIEAYYGGVSLFRMRGGIAIGALEVLESASVDWETSWRLAMKKLLFAIPPLVLAGFLTLYMATPSNRTAVFAQAATPIRQHLLTKLRLPTRRRLLPPPCRIPIR